jgi:hypothetical protein
VRCTPSLALLVACLTLAACAAPDPDAQVLAGRFGPEQPLVLSNLSVPDGRYEVSAEVDLVVSGVLEPFDLTCRLIDTSGQLNNFGGAILEVAHSGVVAITFTSTYELPDITLGLRCYPDTDVVLDVLVRSAQITTERL